MNETAERSPSTAPVIHRGATRLTALGLAVVLAALVVLIVGSQQQTKSRILDNFSLRGVSSATFVSTYLGQQAGRERQAAEQFLAGRHVSSQRFDIIVGAFGSPAAALLDARGRPLEVVPAVPALAGRQIAANDAYLMAAERGRVGISDVVHSAAEGAPITAVAVPFATPQGRRVFSAGYPASGTGLEALVDHTITYSQHQVYLLDANGRLIAASPRTSSDTLAVVAPALARAVAHSSRGYVDGARTPSTFTVASIPGTSWRLVVAVPNSRLYASMGGWSLVLPWLVFVLVALLGVMLIALLGRSQVDRARLAMLSNDSARTARTDALTELSNRRALTEQLTRALAHARRCAQPVSVLMIDLDRFKETNDRFGHEAGDQVLCAVADCMRDVLRAEDSYGRWGGDEFLVVLPDTDEAGARIAAGRVRDAAAAVDLSDIGLDEGVPMSVGAATGVHANPRDLVREADHALYAAKLGPPGAGESGAQSSWNSPSR